MSAERLQQEAPRARTQARVQEASAQASEPEYPTAPSCEHRLEGLEPSNLLAFLALLGALRALTKVRPEWRARVRWDADSFPLRPVLSAVQELTVSEIAQAVALGCDAMGADYDFGGAKLLNWTQAEARSLMRRALRHGPSGRDRADLLSALATDVAVSRDAVIATCFCLMWGQGNQCFLERLARAPRWQWPRRAIRSGKQLVFNPAQMIMRALFVPWRRIDDSPALRWDYIEDRRHALRAFDPQSSSILTVSGANTLAAVGLPMLTLVPASVRGRIGVRTVGVRSVDWQTQFTWPIWTRASSIPVIRAMLSDPALCEDKPDEDHLRCLGIVELQRASRIKCGKYFNFSEARTVLTP